MDGYDVRENAAIDQKTLRHVQWMNKVPPAGPPRPHREGCDDAETDDASFLRDLEGGEVSAVRPFLQDVERAVCLL